MLYGQCLFGHIISALSLFPGCLEGNLEFGELYQQRWTRALLLAKMANEGMGDGKFQERLVRVTPIWYIYSVAEMIFNIYGVDTGEWVIESMNFDGPYSAVFTNKQELFDTLEITDEGT